jgi:hypothetical protein
MAEYSIHDDLMYRHWDRWTDYSYNHIAFSIIDLNNKSPKTNYTDIMEGERFHSPMPPFVDRKVLILVQTGGIFYMLVKN